ncbi:FAD-dependent oxidoreductase [Actinomadura rupiterrae]|uniref:FAD-dependent oxidoreductase n=1 Tax=Actinomadura rupiterrae TaxID=559627 RepID=UPI0020A2A75F|nr:FAD-dependent oxidoreductase [Actinomadura rupiterrae]MCP2338686.1 NADPH-dependent 2,4-dienoyl-CoA reductase/sulfur reductase-like enzyme [Actinomadura rupiterrae]
MTHPDAVVVVGGGLAGHTAVATLRSCGYQGRITMVTREPEAPYDRPPLSKELLSDASFEPALNPRLDYLDVDLRTATAAVGIRRGEVLTETGSVPFDAAVLAPGLRARRLPAGPGAPPARVLRTLDDAVRLRAELVPGRNVLIAGAGLIGAEVATAAAAAGCRVAVVGPEFGPALDAAPAAVLDAVRGWYGERGVELTIGTRVLETTPAGVLLSDTGFRPADVVVAAIGGEPATSWLRGMQVVLDPAGFISTDEYLRTPLPGVYAAGDAVAWRSSRYGVDMHLEHWHHAAESAQVAARNILGSAETYDPLPYFWSHQLGHSLHYVGRHDPGDTADISPAETGTAGNSTAGNGTAGNSTAGNGTARNGTDARSGWSVTWTRGGRPTAVLAIDAPHLVRRARKVLDAATQPELGAAR